MLQGSIVPHGPYVWLCGHLHAVLQGEGDGHSAERRGVSGYRPGHWDPVWPGDYVGSQCGTVYGGPASGPAGRSGFTSGEEKLLIVHYLDLCSFAYRILRKISIGTLKKSDKTADVIEYFTCSCK